MIAYLRAILEAAGYRVHVYTSPHLVRFHERIRLAGALIERAGADRPARGMRAAPTAASRSPSSRSPPPRPSSPSPATPADILLLETGLGGALRRDQRDRRSRWLPCIMPISIDHMQFLGDTLAKIAVEKAGIMKRDRPGDRRRRSRRRPPPCSSRAPRSSTRRSTATAAEWHFADRTARASPIAIAAGAIAAADAGPARPASIRQCRHRHRGRPAAGRISTVDAGASARRSAQCGVAGAHAASEPRSAGRRCCRAGWELWLDGGHNEDAGQVIADMIARLAARRSRSRSASSSACSTSKDPLAFLRHLAPVPRICTAVGIPGDHASLVGARMRSASRARPDCRRRASSRPAAALAAIVARHGSAPRRVLICGSLYLAGTVLAENG